MPKRTTVILNCNITFVCVVPDTQISFSFSDFLQGQFKSEKSDLKWSVMKIECKIDYSRIINNEQA